MKCEELLEVTSLWPQLLVLFCTFKPIPQAWSDHTFVLVWFSLIVSPPNNTARIVDTQVATLSVTLPMKGCIYSDLSGFLPQDDLFINADFRVPPSGLSNMTLPSRQDEQWALLSGGSSTFLYLALDQTPSVHMVLSSPFTVT